MPNPPIPKLAAPVLEKPGARVPLSKFEFAEKFLEQEGRCYKCRERLVRGQVIDEHLVPRDCIPADRCDALENRKLFCKACAKAKTVTDQAIIAKGRRLRGERGSQYAKRKANGPQIRSDRKIPQPPVSALSSKHPGYKKQAWGKR